MSYVSTKDLHTEEVKVRLTESDRGLLEAIARREDVPPAVIARRLIVQQLSDSKQNTIAQSA